MARDAQAWLGIHLISLAKTKWLQSRLDSLDASLSTWACLQGMTHIGKAWQYLGSGVAKEWKKLASKVDQG